MRYLATIIGFALAIVGAVGAFDSFASSRQVENVWQQVSERIKFYGCGGLFASGVIIISLAGIESAIEDGFRRKSAQKDEIKKSEVDDKLEPS